MRMKAIAVLLALMPMPLAWAEPATREEAEAFVRKAVSFLDQQGRSRALEEFNNPKGRFVAGELYIVALDMQGVVLAAGNKPRMVGKSLLDIKDMHGKHFVRREIELAKSKGKGWVDFIWPHPETGALSHRASYVERSGDVIVLTGVYGQQ